ncbi:MAG TPA: hypothetical protein VHH88_10975 [Verrucomicrobiae bacterium]|nr:hypothetical protein [Verrucomicrobiae bacterium]
MKEQKSYLGARRAEPPVIALFGRGRLVKKSRTQFELVGGTRDDYAEAREWVSFFLHEAVLSPLERTAG